ncbi:25427_t:CDS:1 [Gigaspora rosea]|nr:25427_t:CDS:1 [Gigaspora rosea]
MPQEKTQKARTNSTLACVNCQRRHLRCEKILSEDACTNCRKYNRPCLYIPGNKRGPKRHRQNTGFANFQPFSNINPYEDAHNQYREQLTFSSSYPTSEAAYTQCQLTPNIDSISYPIPVVYTQYQEHLTPNVGNNSYQVSDITEIQNIFINQSTSSSSLAHDELMSNNEQHIMSSSFNNYPMTSSSEFNIFILILVLLILLKLMSNNEQHIMSSSFNSYPMTSSSEFNIFILILVLLILLK